MDLVKNRKFLVQSSFLNKEISWEPTPELKFNLGYSSISKDYENVLSFNSAAGFENIKYQLNEYIESNSAPAGIDPELIWNLKEIIVENMN